MDSAATIVGAGSVGLALAVRLARAGIAVRLVVRRPEAACSLSERGLVGEHPATGQRLGVRVRATADAGWAGEATGPIFVCTRADAVEAVARAASTASPVTSTVPRASSTAPRALVTFQNDVGNEELAAQYGAIVIGGVWRETTTRRADDRVCLQWDRPGRAVVGLHPSGQSAVVEGVATLLRRGGVDVSVSQTIGRDKWLKLCINLMSAPNALVRRSDHAAAAFVEVKVRLLEEAQAVLAAAGIDARPCDERDRPLAREIAFQRDALARGTSARSLPLYNHVWTALASGAPLEADAYHERILALAARHGVAAPVNRIVLEQLRCAERSRLGPESLEARALLPG